MHGVQCGAECVVPVCGVSASCSVWSVVCAVSRAKVMISLLCF